MHLSYDGIMFDVLHLEDWMREAVYSPDQTTFLYWHHQIVVTCILNVDAVAPNRMPAPEFGEHRPRYARPLPGAPGQIHNSRMRNLDGNKSGVFTPRTDLKPEEFAGLFAAGETSGGAFGGGGDFGPGPSGPTDNIGKPLPSGGFRPLPSPPPGFTGGGDFSPFKKRPPKPPGAKFEFGPPDAGRANPFVGGLPNIGARSTVPFSDVELRNRLRRPRRQLLVWLNSGPNGAPEFMLVSPLHPDAGCDAMHGPVCTIMDVPEIHGNVSAILRLKFDTWEAPPLEFESQSVNNSASTLRTPNAFTSAESKAVDAARKAYIEAISQGKSALEAIRKADEAVRQQGLKELTEQQIEIIKKAAAAGDGGPPVVGAGEVGGDVNRRRALRTPALLSNRWTMSFGWNPENYLRTQLISGEAIFRMDVLHMRGLTADQLRGYLWHPIPGGYRRLPIEQDDVVLSPGGNSILYRIVDEQVMMNFPGGVQFGMIHADVQMELEYSGYNVANLPGGSDAWGKDGGSRMRSVPKHTTR